MKLPLLTSVSMLLVNSFSLKQLTGVFLKFYMKLEGLKGFKLKKASFPESSDSGGKTQTFSTK